MLCAVREILHGENCSSTLEGNVSGNNNRGLLVLNTTQKMRPLACATIVTKAEQTEKNKSTTFAMRCLATTNLQDSEELDYSLC